MVDARIAGSARAGPEDETPARMESESESRDIGSVQQRTLPPIQPWEGTGLDSIREERSPQVLSHRVAIDAVDTTDTAVAHVADASTLPSTVPESDHGVPPPHSQPLQTMNSPNAATQELPASEVDNIVAKSRSRIARDGPTQLTLNEGDEGAVDLISSFVQEPNGNDNNGDDHDGDDASEASLDKAPSIGSSPHTQNALTQFPESQRFKTPATAGKKRDYLGNTKETPDLPRPDLRFGEATPAHVIGLSQAFDATQAQTSPVTNGIAQPPLDRPSPTVDIELRPAIITSPAMRPITEPDARYVSMAQSQAERYRRASSNLPDDDSDDDFSNRTDHLEKQRREQARLDRITKSSLSSPPKRRRRASPALVRPSSPAQLHLNPRDLNESEAETEQDEEDDNDGLGLEQPRPDIDIENKENDERMIIQIPQTVIRLQRATQDVPLLPSDSPLFCPDGRVYVSSSPAVANSQFSQPFPRGQLQLKSSSNSDIDCVPQSQADQPAQHDQEVQSSQLRGDRQERSEDLGPDANHLQSQFSTRRHLDDTIAESSSSKRPQSGSRLPDHKPLSCSDTTSNFETAQSCLPPASSSRSNLPEMSSPPIVTAAPGRKRKQMGDISGGPSSQMSSQGFDPVQALCIDKDLQLELSQSPTQARTNRPKVRSRRGEIILTRNSLEDQGVKPPHHIISQGHIPMTDLPLEDTQTPRTPIARPRSGLRRANRSATTTTTTRAHVWDHEVSPEKPASPPQDPVRAKLSVLSSRLSRHISTTTDDAKKSQWHQGHPPDPTRSRKAPEEAEVVARQAPSAPPTASRPSTPTLLSDPPTTVIPSHPTKALAADRIIAPDMVFACFNGKTRAYYPARCLEKIDTDGDLVRYRVEWDATDPDEVDAYGIRAIDLRVDDQVKIDMKGFAKAPYVVRGFKEKVDTTQAGNVMTDIRGFRTILVARKQRKGLPADISTEATQEVPIAAIYLDNNMWGQLKNRALEFRPQSSQPISTSGHATPVERQATPNTPSSRTRKPAAYTASVSLSPVQGLFANMVFAISYDDPAMKDTVATAIQENGGTVVRDSFMELLQSDAVALKPEYQTVGFTSLLADDFSRKEKYMQALALGLPCLSGRWILDSVDSESLVDWQTYLLPAGESAALDGAVRSRVLPDLLPHDAKLVDMLQSRPQPLAKMTVAAVVGKGKAEARRKPYLFLIHALGAASISKFPDVKAAKDHVAQRDTDWLFVDDRDVDAAEAELSGNKMKHSSSKCKVAGNELIVQSVILGKLYT